MRILSQAEFYLHTRRLCCGRYLWMLERIDGYQLSAGPTLTLAFPQSASPLRLSEPPMGRQGFAPGFDPRL